MISDTLKVGDYVTVFGSRGWSFGTEPTGIYVVKRVMKKFIELENGSKWDTNWGHPYPRSAGYHKPHIEPTTTEHQERMHQLDLQSSIKGWVEKELDKASLNTLCKIWDAIDPPETGDDTLPIKPYNDSEDC